nr:hypothetical protein [Tanacetum cinerariifolium]
MGLLDFVKSADPFKVKTGERTLTEGEVLLITKTVDVLIAHSVQTVRLVDHNIINELDEHVGKKKRKVVFDDLPGNESGSAPHPTEEFVFSSVTPTPEHGILDDFGSTQDINVQAWHPLVKSPLLHVDVEVENIRNVAAAFANGARTSSIPSDDVEASTFVPSDESPVDDFFKSQTVKSRDAEIVDFKAKLERTEGEVAKVTDLRKRASNLEFAVASKASEVVTLNVQNAELLGKVSTLELVREESNGKVSQLTMDCDGLQGKVVGEAKMRDIDTDLYPYANCYRGTTMGEELEGLNDSWLSLRMSALTLKDDHGEMDTTLEFHNFQSSFNQ